MLRAQLSDTVLPYMHEVLDSTQAAGEKDKQQEERGMV